MKSEMAVRGDGLGHFWQRLGWRIACVLAIGAAELSSRSARLGVAQARWAVASEVQLESGARLEAFGRIPMPAGAESAHASHLLVPSGAGDIALQAHWFAGSRESGPDVQIAASDWRRSTRAWTPARYVANREVAGQALGFHVRRFGNPVAWQDASGRTHLFVVATGLGGWAASRVLHMRQDSGAAPFQSLRVLPLAWLWNLSHLVRASPLPLADGGMALPIYFELGKKYPLVLRFDAAGQFRGVSRISRLPHRLQPTLVAQAPARWLALMRDNGSGRRIHVAQTEDGGRTWFDRPDMAFANPDAAIAALAVSPDKLFLAYNPQPDGRRELALDESRGGHRWQEVDRLASGPAGTEFSYPSLAWAEGSLWVSYTDQRQSIAWRRYAPKAVAPGG